VESAVENTPRVGWAESGRVSISRNSRVDDFSESGMKG